MNSLNDPTSILNPSNPFSPYYDNGNEYVETSNNMKNSKIINKNTGRECTRIEHNRRINHKYLLRERRWLRRSRRHDESLGRRPKFYNKKQSKESGMRQI